MFKVEAVLILLVTDPFAAKQYLLPQLSCCTTFSTPKLAKVALGLRKAGAINFNTEEFYPYTNLPTGIHAQLTTGTSLKNMKRIHR